MNDEDPPPDPNGDSNQTDESEEYDEAPSKFETAVGYMGSEKGHEVMLRVVAMLEQNAPALNSLLQAKIESYRTGPKMDFWKWSLLLVVRFLVFLAAVASLIYMRRTGTVDPAIVVLIGGLVAYFFGYNRSQS